MGLSDEIGVNSSLPLRVQENKNIFHIRFSLSVGNLIDLAALKITRKGECFVIILPLKISQQVKT